jgi:hypothetical protein
VLHVVKWWIRVFTTGKSTSFNHLSLNYPGLLKDDNNLFSEKILLERVEFETQLIVCLNNPRKSECYYNETFAAFATRGHSFKSSHPNNKKGQYYCPLLLLMQLCCYSSNISQASGAFGAGSSGDSVAG